MPAVLSFCMMYYARHHLPQPHSYSHTPTSSTPTPWQGVWCQWQSWGVSSGKIPSDTRDARHQGGCGSVHGDDIYQWCDSDIILFCRMPSSWILVLVGSLPGWAVVPLNRRRKQLSRMLWYVWWYQCLMSRCCDVSVMSSVTLNIWCNVASQLLYTTVFCRTSSNRRTTRTGPMWHVCVREQRHHCLNRILATGLIEMKLPLSSNQRGPNKQVHIHLQLEILALAGNTKTCLF